MPCRVLTIFQQASVTASGGYAAGLLQFVVGAVGEAQNQVIEIFAKLVFPGQQLQHASLGCRSGIDNEVAIPHENGAGNFALCRRQEAHCSGAQVKCSDLALQIEVTNAHCLPA